MHFETATVGCQENAAGGEVSFHSCRARRKLSSGARPFGSAQGKLAEGGCPHRFDSGDCYFLIARLLAAFAVRTMWSSHNTEEIVLASRMVPLMTMRTAVGRGTMRL